MWKGRLCYSDGTVLQEKGKLKKTLQSPLYHSSVSLNLSLAFNIWSLEVYHARKGQVDDLLNIY